MISKDYIFLDFDGVLNNRQWFIECKDQWISDTDNKLLLPHPTKDVDPVLVSNVNRLVEQTGANVIVSSTWRILNSLDQLQATINRAGGTFKLSGVTPRHIDNRFGGRAYRGDEIQWFIDNNVEGIPNRIVILDDDGDMLHLMPHLAKSRFEFGFTEEVLMKALDLFYNVPYRVYSNEEYRLAQKNWAMRSSMNIRNWNAENPDDLIEINLPNL